MIEGGRKGGGGGGGQRSRRRGVWKCFRECACCCDCGHIRIMPAPRCAAKCGREVCQSSPCYHRTPDERRRGGRKLHHGAAIDWPAILLSHGALWRANVRAAGVTCGWSHVGEVDERRRGHEKRHNLRGWLHAFVCPCVRLCVVVGSRMRVRWCMGRCRFVSNSRCIASIFKSTYESVTLSQIMHIDHLACTYT
jgi:hypothetical protein